MEHREADIRPAASRGASGDDAARFLDELRQLRSGAGLGHAELAARAHYPYDSIRAAEVGPSLPDLPVLSAFVRACGGTTEEWEERWRSLTKSPSLPLAGARQSGRSDAANAGARLNSGSQPGENPDPSIIIAALSRVAEEMATPGADEIERELEAETAAETVAPLPARAPADFPPFPPLPDDLGSEKSAGWDPIRVSSAWPVLNHTPTVAEPPRGTASPGGAGVPWDTAPWADAAGAASSPAVSAGATAAGPAAAGRTARIAIMVIAAVALCALIAALAIFA